MTAAGLLCLAVHAWGDAGFGAGQGLDVEEFLSEARAGAAPEMPAGRSRARPQADPAEELFAKAMADQIRRYPIGKRLIEGMPSLPEVSFVDLGVGIFGRLDLETRAIQMNTLQLSQAALSLDAAAGPGDLRDPAALKSFLAAQPRLVEGIVDLVDSYYIHELAHAAQYAALGDDWWGPGTPDSPLGEWDAFETQALYFHEKVALNPAYLDSEFVPSDYLAYVYADDLSQYRRAKAAIYSHRAPSDGKLAPGVWEYYGGRLEESERRWPRTGYEGCMLLAGKSVESGDVSRALMFLDSAYKKARRHGFLGEREREEIGVLLEKACHGLGRSLEAGLGFREALALRRLAALFPERCGRTQ
ncbi:MAG: hypothetical protein HY748_17955 [Elusimicrobia bacterium]|nr:hypothetical protein [Elusimicrobiota bacterium]